MNEKEFISSWVLNLTSEGIKNFPADFISINNYTELKLPGKTLLIGEEFFGKYEIITADGNSVLHANSYLQTKFIIYSNRNKPGVILIPLDESELKGAIQIYESYLDSIIKSIEKTYNGSFYEAKNSKFVVNEIFRQLNLVRL